jgi:hypothetical protein
MLLSYRRAANHKSEDELLHGCPFSGLPVARPVFFNPSRHAAGCISQPIRFSLLQIFQDVRRLTPATKMTFAASDPTRGWVVVKISQVQMLFWHISYLYIIAYEMAEGEI